jgi:hypothetical protein
VEQAKVFISSILKVSLEDLRAERKVVREVVESHPFLRAWAFEKAPASFEDLDESYLRNVDDCDIFVVIVGSEASNPVAAEVQRAKQRNKPILAFARACTNRKPIAQMLLDTTGTKYANFQSAEELRHAIGDAINHALVLGVRSLSGIPQTLSGELRQLKDKGTHFYIKPMIPALDARRRFHIENLDQRAITVRHHATDESIQIPVSRVSEIINVGESDPPTLLLEGRLQWVTTIQRWRFLPETPETGTTLGFCKQSGTNDPRVLELCDQFRAKGFEPGWAAESELPGRLSADFQLVYDDDGLYFRIPDRLQTLALVVKRQSRR